MNEESWISQLRAGDEKAFESIFHAYYKALCVFAEQLLSDTKAAEEVVDDTLMALWHRRESLPEIASLGSYIYRAVRNASLNYVRDHQHELVGRISPNASAQMAAIVDKAFADTVNPLEHLLESQLREAAMDGINRLPDKCRQAFLMSRMEGRSYPEIATALGISENTVKYHIKTALAELRHHLARFIRLVLIFFCIN